MESKRDLRALPKGHLPLHLDGAVRHSTLAELAAEAGISVPATTDFAGFSGFSEVLAAAQLAIDSEADLRRVVDEVVEDAATDGALWVEISVWPGFLRGRLGSLSDVTELILEAGKNAAAACGIGFGLDGDVAASPPGQFVTAAQIARDTGLLSTPHAGEFGNTDNVLVALEQLHADRILHGSAWPKIP